MTRLKLGGSVVRLLGMDTNIQDDVSDTALIYDGECPVCTAYGGAAEIEQGASPLRRIDARSNDPLVARATEAGLDLDDGMVLLHGGKLYHGADAIQMMARLSPRKGFYNRFSRLLFGSRHISHLIYPFLRAGRNALLWVRRRSKIRNLGA